MTCLIRWTTSRDPRTDHDLGQRMWPGCTTEIKYLMQKMIFTSCLNKSYPPVPEVLQSQFISEFAGRHGIWQILFVSEHQKCGVPQLVLLKLQHDMT